MKRVIKCRALRIWERPHRGHDDIVDLRSRIGTQLSHSQTGDFNGVNHSLP